VDIEIVMRPSESGEMTYFLHHDFDLEIFTDLPCEGPFASREDAEIAASRLQEALACVND